MSDNQIRHVVFIGDTGSGKSSVINLIASPENPTNTPIPTGPARVSSDAAPCTVEFASYDVSIEGRLYKLWDTPGLNRPKGFFSKLFRRPSSTEVSLTQFLQKRRRLGELDLIMFCFRGTGRVHGGMCNAYKRFCGPARKEARIPVATAITHLEKEQPAMEVWWQHNERALRELGLEFDGYACITCLESHHRRWASRRDTRDLILRVCRRQG